MVKSVSKRLVGWRGDHGGSITAGMKDFKIDDPLDPAGKYLTHACIESDEMADLYSGNVVTDAQGNAVVTMPRWFQALNTDFRYQLTVLGQFAQAVVSSEIQNNRFTIKTDKPNVKVSWQVTGVRQDAYAHGPPASSGGRQAGQGAGPVPASRTNWDSPKSWASATPSARRTRPVGRSCLNSCSKVSHELNDEGANPAKRAPRRRITHMKRLGSSSWFLLGLLLTSVSLARADSIIVKPASPQAALGTTLQFSAQVSGAPLAGVTWSAGGVKGGNAKAGTITPAGLYQAPAVMPGQNPVLITATGPAGSPKPAGVYVYLLTPGPAITAVSPNPLAVGNLSVTIQGTGFLPGAIVYDNYGSYGAIQLSTTAVTATTVTASGYQGNASTATFTVKNPGSDYSNALTVPIGGSTTGHVRAERRQRLRQRRSTPPARRHDHGERAARRTVVPGLDRRVRAESPAAATTTLTMPAANATVTATYSTAGTYVLNVVNGTGSGSYAAGTVVTITANAPPAGQSFAGWTGAAVQNATRDDDASPCPPPIRRDGELLRVRVHAERRQWNRQRLLRRRHGRDDHGRTRRRPGSSSSTGPARPCRTRMPPRPR